MNEVILEATKFLKGVFVNLNLFVNIEIMQILYLWVNIEIIVINENN